MTDTEIEQGKQKLWYIRRNGKVKGPFPSGTIRRFVLLGRVMPTDLVSSDRQQWRKVRDTPEVVSPDVRRAIAEGNLDQLLPAKLREDERSGRDRRATSGAIPHDRRRKSDRRREEPEVLRKHRAAKTELRELSTQRKMPVTGMAVIGILTLVIIGYGLYLGAPAPIPDPDCSASAAPGVNWRNCRLDRLVAESVNLKGAVLHNGILRDARLSGSDFTSGNLEYADLSGADLSYANFTGTSMKGVGLRNSDLSYADFSGADLSFAILTGANLGGANLAGADFGNAIWIDGSVCMPGSIGGCRAATE